MMLTVKRLSVLDQPAFHRFAATMWPAWVDLYHSTGMFSQSFKSNRSKAVLLVVSLLWRMKQTCRHETRHYITTPNNVRYYDRSLPTFRAKGIGACALCFACARSHCFASSQIMTVINRELGHATRFGATCSSCSCSEYPTITAAQRSTFQRLHSVLLWRLKHMRPQLVRQTINTIYIARVSSHGKNVKHPLVCESYPPQTQ
jgi:hypothetical protein